MNGDSKFLTNKWLIGILVTLTIGMGGYIFRGIDKSGDANAADLGEIRRRVTVAEIAIARTEVQYVEIIRRLDRMENNYYLRSRARNEAP